MKLKDVNSLSLQAFTLVELLVSISIMTIILGITLSGGPSALMRLSLADNAYTSELLIREAQLQGSAVNSVNGTFGGAGVFFNRATPSTVVKFKDKVDSALIHAIGIGNGLYDTTPTDEFDKQYSLTNNHKINKLCVATSTPPFTCNDDNPTLVPIINNLTISFIRPNQGAHIYINNSALINYSAACIQFDSVKSPDAGYVRSVIIYRSGMITKKIGTCASI
jgi:prepilin-type N-terminal cleavage/methylation domain-containing protein